MRLYANTNEIYDDERPDNLAVMTAIEAVGFAGVRGSVDVSVYAPRPDAAYYSRTILTAQADWLASRGLRFILILGYGPPNNQYWQALGGEWRHYNIPTEEWRAVRPPAGTANAVWLAEAAAYIDMIDTVRDVYTGYSLDPDQYVIVSYNNEPRNVTAGTVHTVTEAASTDTILKVTSAVGFAGGNRICVLTPAGAEYASVQSISTIANPDTITLTAPLAGGAPAAGIGVGKVDSYANDGSIDAAFHSRAAVIVPLLRAAYPTMVMAAPCVWGVTNNVPTLLQTYIDHWATNAAGSTAYAADFDIWPMNCYLGLQLKQAFTIADVHAYMATLINTCIDYFRSKAVLGMNTKPIAMHEFGLAPDEAGMGYFGRPDHDYVLGQLRRACCEAAIHSSLDHAALYTILNSASMDASATRRHGCIKITGDARASLIPLMEMAGDDVPATVPAGYNNAGSAWAVQSGEPVAPT